MGGEAVCDNTFVLNFTASKPIEPLCVLMKYVPKIGGIVSM